MRRMFGLSRMGLAGVVLAMALLTMGAGSASATFIQQVPRFHGSEIEKTLFGESVALSKDGNTALVGSPDEEPTGTGFDRGAAWVFTRANGKWGSGLKLSPNHEVGVGSRFGQSVALSQDGNTALIGGYTDGLIEGPETCGPSTPPCGAAWVFTRSVTGVWTEAQKLTSNEEVNQSFFGWSVALSADGSTALIGGMHDGGGFVVEEGKWVSPYVTCTNCGAAWVFARSGTGEFTQEGPKLHNAAPLGRFGASVALSGNGNIALVGEPEGGAAWGFTRSGGSWTAGPKVSNSESSQFGFSVALSNAGNTALIGGNDGVWVFAGPGGAWAEEQKLQNAGSTAALSADGNTALTSRGVAEAVVFKRPTGGVWTEGQKLSSNSEEFFVEHFALSGDANTALFGSIMPTGEVGGVPQGNAGAAWAWVNPPEVTSVSPNAGPLAGGTSVTITGSNFTGATAVKFGTNSATLVKECSATQCEVTTPAGTGTVKVTVTTSAGTTTAAQEFTYVPPPTVTKLKPNEGPGAGGTTVTITGTNFAGATAVKFNSISASSFKVVSPTSITAVSPAGTGVVDVSVTTAGGPSAISVADKFSYLPVVTAVAPKEGPVAGGTTVTITGKNFIGATAVKFGLISASSFKVVSPTSITAVSPAELAGPVDVTVTTPGGASVPSSKDKFTFTPTVTNLSPNTGLKVGGTKVTVTGTGFVLGKTATSFKFEATKGAGVNCTSTTTCTVVAPAHAIGKVDVIATVNKASSPKNAPADQFTYN